MWLFLRSVGEEALVMLPSAMQSTSVFPCPMLSSTPSVSQLGRRETREPFHMMVCESSTAFLFIRIVYSLSDPCFASQLTATAPIATTTITSVRLKPGMGRFMDTRPPRWGLAAPGVARGHRCYSSALSSDEVLWRRASQCC